MLFNSYSFLFLVIVTLTLYYVPRFKSLQLYILIISSFVFYGFHVPLLLLLLIFSGSINAISSYIIYHSNDVKRRKLAATSGVLINLLILISFKYNGMLGHLVGLSVSVEKEWVDWFVLLPLPIGISFYTFQGISLLVDVYRQQRGDRESWHITIPQSFLQHYRDTLFFISFFPQLIAGPIVKAHDFLPQISTKKLCDVAWEYSFRTLVLGYFLKMVVADNLQNQTFWIGFYDIQSTLTLVVLMFGYSIQIFADFAGYSLIAIGIASLFGYRLPQNFDFPYFSRSFGEFWKRWHMTLGLWLKEYLYIPLGGNRKGEFRNYVNLMVVMVLGGLWHGASMNYIAWGAYHGALLVGERMLGQYVVLPKQRWVELVKVLFVFTLVTLGWLFFQMDMDAFYGLLHALVHNAEVAHNMGVLSMIFFYTLPVILYYADYLLRKIWGNYAVWIEPKMWAVYALMLFAIIFQSGNAGAFIYFQF